MSGGTRINIDDYLLKFEPETRELARDVRQTILTALPGLNEVVKWGHLVYEKDKMICSIMVHKKHVNLQIWRGAEIDDPENMLEGNGKSMRHVKIHSKEDIKMDYFKFLIEQAAKIIQ